MIWLSFKIFFLVVEVCGQQVTRQFEVNAFWIKNVYRQTIQSPGQLKNESLLRCSKNIAYDSGITQKKKSRVFVSFFFFH